MGSLEEPPPFHFQHQAVDDGRPIRVVIIGAGVSGIGLYIRLRQYVPSATLTVFEKNSGVGGTWLENRYPGVACDIPSHVYQYTFEPHTQWTKFFSPGAEILEYVRGVAKKYQIEDKVHFDTRVTGAMWDDVKGLWTVTTKKTSDGVETVSTEAEVVINGTGLLNNWKYPEIEGLLDFEGKLQHSANWDLEWDYTGKDVALIGCGSSAIQMLPHLQRRCKSVYNFVRGRTWVSEPFGGAFTQDTLAGDDEPGNYSYTAEELNKFKNDPSEYWKYRKEMERFINMDHPCLFPGTPEQVKGTEAILENMRKKLAKKPEILESLKPEFIPGCRRLTPGPGYLEALVEDNVHFIKNTIVKVTKDSVITADGTVRKVDGIACATGFDTSHTPRFPVTGRNGAILSTRWKEYASAYLSHSVPNFPNYYIVGGPNSATGGGSLLIIFESIIGYVVKAVQKLAREHLKSIEVKESALAGWERYMDSYFPTTVHVGGCTSWYKAGVVDHKVVGLWPGSSLHAKKTLDHPRWEDFNYSRLPGQDVFEWLGDGWTVADKTKGDVSYYLDEVDFPPVPREAKIVSVVPGKGA